MVQARDSMAGLLRLAAAVLFFYWAWEQWQQIAAFEAGADIKVKMWAPLAWIYNQGGIWPVIAKWVGQVFTVFFGFVWLLWGISDLRNARGARRPT